MKKITKYLACLALLTSSCFGSFSEGEIHFNNGEYEKAIREFSQTLFINVTDINSLHLRARAYEELERYEEALEDYKRIISIDPRYAQAHAGIGKLYWNQEDYLNAEKHLLIAAKYDENDFEIIYLLGRAMIMNENFKSADEFFSIAKELKPKDARVYFYQGMARSQIGDVLGAAGSFNMCLNYDPSNHAALYNRGLVRMTIGYVAWALEDFEELLKINPNHIEALARRGICKKTLKIPTACQDLIMASNKGSEIARLNLEGC
ncbi:tetratricopeptide repeat protein [Belliella baltica DSM 15883]|uniref:Tetratricopeptide repeat protein n=1 Tax=Belliella baltica (strain DSM 15883 / CIP 108006 / LMG 21964 / BA134) TaxID=866536 RepID=I3Z6A7_BELBD|nr:tetratricopeptide repeat protein [Belliella baltica]AFL84775.1 tetratricopeptide repeat protein [Belliella baltica DSM 15883]